MLPQCLYDVFVDPEWQLTWGSQETLMSTPELGPLGPLSWKPEDHGCVLLGWTACSTPHSLLQHLLHKTRRTGLHQPLSIHNLTPTHGIWASPVTMDREGIVSPTVGTHSSDREMPKPCACSLQGCVKMEDVYSTCPQLDRWFWKKHSHTCISAAKLARGGSCDMSRMEAVAGTCGCCLLCFHTESGRAMCYFCHSLMPQLQRGEP